MRLLAAVLGVFLISAVLWEAFETIVFPRHVTRRFRLTRLFYRNSWRAFQFMVDVSRIRQRDTLLSFFGPLSLLLLISVWAGGLILGFALLHWADGSAVQANQGPPGFLTDLYLSGTTFFTLGLGDVTPLSPFAKLFTVVECGMGLGFLALIISYLPALNQSFQRREISISLLDARAGSPPSAAEILRRHREKHGLEALRILFHEWELWSAELLETHLSYPVLAYFRSQHENQSWLAALTAILDASALVLAGVEGACARQAELTFAIARHAMVDLSIVFRRPPKTPAHDRLQPDTLNALREALKDAGHQLHDHHESEKKLAELRSLYEPYAYSLSQHFRMPLPPWVPKSERPDNWQISAWERSSTVMKKMKDIEEDRHF